MHPRASTPDARYKETYGGDYFRYASHHGNYNIGQIRFTIPEDGIFLPLPVHHARFASSITAAVTSIIPRRAQKFTRLLLHRSVPDNPLSTRGGGGDGWRDGAAAGVFQIITSGCGGGGSPWQPQCLQHPTTEGNRATERNPVLLLRTSESECARGPVGNGSREHQHVPTLADGIE